VVPIFHKTIPPHFLALYNAAKSLQITHVTMQIHNRFAASLQVKEKKGTKYVSPGDHCRQTAYTEVD
jgi:hypothetical protein